jgi:hypothetical protein
MSNKYDLCYDIEGSVIDLESPESEETKEVLKKIIELYKAEKYAESDALKPPMSFEFNAENMDSDYSDWLVNPHVYIDLDPEGDNGTVSMIYMDDQLKLHGRVRFEIELKEGVKPEKFQTWLEDNGGWAACSVLGDWSCTEDEGGDLFVVGIKRKRR